MELEKGKRHWRKLWHDAGEQFIADWEKEQLLRDSLSQFLDEAVGSRARSTGNKAGQFFKIRL